MSKQDRQGVRTPAHLEQKYRFAKTFAEQEESATKQDKQIDTLNQKTTKLEEDTASLKGTSDKLTTAYKDFGKVLLGLNSNITNMSQVLDSLVETSSSMNERINELVNTTFMLDSRIADLEQIVYGIVREASGRAIYLTDSVNFKLSRLTLYGKTTQDGTPTPDAPVALVSAGDGGSINVNVCGKNLADNKVYKTNGQKGNFYINSDVITSPIERGSWGGVGVVVPVLPNTVYMCSSDVTPNHYFNVTFYQSMEDVVSATKAIKYSQVTNANTIKVTTPNGCYCMVVTALDSVEATYIWNWWQVEKGDIATEYEAYKGQTQNIFTSSLSGIPVDSGGDYTDSDGQQWICDEVDFALGKYVQRIGKINSYTSEDVTGAYMSTTGSLSNGATVLYALAEPIVHNLTAEERAAYAALHTNYPNTTIVNDAGAWMTVQYTSKNTES